MLEWIAQLPRPWGIALWATVALLGVLAVALLWIYRKTPAVKRILYEMVCRAEQLYGGGTGQIKCNAVMAWFYAQSPWLSLVLPERKLRLWIEVAVENMKEFLWNSGANLFSLSDEMAFSSGMGLEEAAGELAGTEGEDGLDGEGGA